MKLRILVALVIVVPAVALFLIAGEPGDPPAPTVSLDKYSVPVGANITGVAQGQPAVIVTLLVDDVVEDEDAINEGQVGGKEINQFSFPALPEYEGKHVVVRVTDGSGQTVERTVTITPRKD